MSIQSIKSISSIIPAEYAGMMDAVLNGDSGHSLTLPALILRHNVNRQFYRWLYSHRSPDAHPSQSPKNN